MSTDRASIQTDTLNITPEKNSPSISPSTGGSPMKKKRRSSIFKRLSKSLSFGHSKDPEIHDEDTYKAGEVRGSISPAPDHRRQRASALISWINSHLYQPNRADIEANPLSVELSASVLSDLSNGQLILALLHRLFPKLAVSPSSLASPPNSALSTALLPSPEHNDLSMSYERQKKTIDSILSFLQTKLQLDVSEYDAEKIIKGDEKQIATLVQHILVVHCTALLNTLGYKGTEMEALLEFVNSCTEPRTQRRFESPFVKNFADGMVLCSIMDKIFSGLVPLTELKEANAKGNHMSVLATGTRLVGRQLRIIPPFLLTQFSEVSDTVISTPTSKTTDSEKGNIDTQGAPISPIRPLAELRENRVEEEDIILYICMIISGALGELGSSWTNPSPKSVIHEHKEDQTSTAHEDSKSLSNTSVQTNAEAISSVEDAIHETKPDVTQDLVAHSQAEKGRVESLQKSLDQLEKSSKEFERSTPKNEGTDRKSLPTSQVDRDNPLELEALRTALVESQNGYQKSLELLRTFGNSLAVEMATVDSVGADRNPSIPVSASASTALTDTQSVRNMLMELPAKCGWIMEETFIANGTSFARRYGQVQFDSLYLRDEESTPIVNSQRYSLSDYQLIHLVNPIYEHAAADGRSANESKENQELLSPAAPYKSDSSYPHSVLIREKGAYVLHLLPKTGTTATALHISGADEQSVIDGDQLRQWAEAINARIELLHLLKISNLPVLMSNGGRAILKFLCSPDSRHLRIENQDIAIAATLQHFKELLILRAPYILTLRNVCLKDSDLKIISEICMMNHGVTTLDLSFNAITDEGFAYILSIVELSKGLMHLKLDGNQLTGDGFENLADLLWLRRLRSLSFQGNAVSSDACIHFFNKLYSSIPSTSPPMEMMEINLSDNPIDDTISTSLCLLFKRCTIRRLKLSHTNITDQTVESLAATILSYPSDIELLDFSFNRLTEASLAALSPALLASPSPMQLDLSGINFPLDKLTMLSASGVSLQTSRLVVRKPGSDEFLQLQSTEEIPVDRYLKIQLNASKRLNNTSSATFKPQNLERRMSFLRENAETGEVELLNPTSTAEHQAHEHLLLSESVLNSPVANASPPSLTRRPSVSTTKALNELPQGDTLAAPAPVGTSLDNLEEGNTIRPSDREVQQVERRRNSLSS